MEKIRRQGCYAWEEVKKRTGDSIYVVLWHAEDVDMTQNVKVKVSDTQARVKLDKEKKATILTIPVDLVAMKTFQVDCKWKYTRPK